jgi:hypothetical protein
MAGDSPWVWQPDTVTVRVPVGSPSDSTGIGPRTSRLVRQCCSEGLYQSQTTRYEGNTDKAPENVGCPTAGHFRLHTTDGDVPRHVSVLGVIRWLHIRWL